MIKITTMLLFLSLVSLTRVTAERPNIVFFLIDDLGYMDIGANNPDTFYETPNIDALAASGMRFTDGYAANPVCSPTRYSIMTGKYPSRVDATNFFSGKLEGWFKPAPLHDRMPLDEITLADALKKAGYKTFFAGKWHLGPTEEYWPENRGFDTNIGGWRPGGPWGGDNYFSPYENPRLEDGPKGEYLTHRLASETIEFIKSNKDGPFLAYLSFYTVHTPLMAPWQLVRKYTRKAETLGLIGKQEFATEEQVLPIQRERMVRISQQHAIYAAMVEAMDTNVGRVLDVLKDLGIEDNTVVCFTSDNGGLSTSEGLPTSNLPLRGGKGWTYEGGIREPYLIRWPGVTKPGGVNSDPVCSIDFLPTLLEIAEIDFEHEVDGVSLVPILRENRPIDREALYWHYPHYSNQGGIPSGAIRMGDWKLIERYEDGQLHLYNLKNDIGEKTDLAVMQPNRVASMKSKLHAWYKEVDAKFLQPKDPWKPE